MVEIIGEPSVDANAIALERAILDTRLHDLTDKLQKMIEDLSTHEFTRPAVEHAGTVLWRSISLKDKSYSSTADDTREMEAEMKEIENAFDKLYAFYIGFMSGEEPTTKSRRIRGKQPRP